MVVLRDLGAQLLRALCRGLRGFLAFFLALAGVNAKRRRSRPTWCRRPTDARLREHAVELPGPDGVEAGAVGQVEVQGADGDPALGDRREVGALLVLERGLEAVDLVAAARALGVLVDQLQLVVVEALAEVGDLDARRLARRAVDVDQRVVGDRVLRDAAHQLGGERGRDLEVELAAEAEVHLPRARLLRDRDRRDAEHDPLERGGHGPRVGDVVAEVGAVVDPRDDQVGLLLAGQAEVGEPDAVHRGPVGREAGRAVVEGDLLDPQRRAGGDRAGRRAAVRVRGDHAQLELGHLGERAAKGLQPLRPYAVVVRDQDAHVIDSMNGSGAASPLTGVST